MSCAAFLIEGEGSGPSLDLAIFRSSVLFVAAINKAVGLSYKIVCVFGASSSTNGFVVASAFTRRCSPTVGTWDFLDSIVK